MNGTIATEMKLFQEEQAAKALNADRREREATRYHKAFASYLLGEGDIELKDLRAGIDQAGGYLSGPQFMADLVDAEGTASAMRRISRVLPPTTAESLEVPRQDSRFTDATWTSELLINGLDTSSPYGRVAFRPYPIAKYVKVSKRLLREGGAFALRVITEAIAEAIAVPQELAFIQGSGFGQPLGLLNTPGLPTITTATSVTLAAADVDLFIYKLAGRWHTNAQVLMHVDTAAAISQLDTAGARLIQNGRLLGRYEMVYSDQMPSAGTAPAAMTASTIVAVIGDFSRFWIQDALNGTSVQRLVELYAEAGEDAFIARQETDAAVIDTSAFVALKIKP